MSFNLLEKPELIQIVIMKTSSMPKVNLKCKEVPGLDFVLLFIKTLNTMASNITNKWRCDEKTLMMLILFQCI